MSFPLEDVLCDNISSLVDEKAFSFKAGQHCLHFKTTVHEESDENSLFSFFSLSSFFFLVFIDSAPKSVSSIHFSITTDVYTAGTPAKAQEKRNENHVLLSTLFSLLSLPLALPVANLSHSPVTSHPLLILPIRACRSGYIYQPIRGCQGKRVTASAADLHPHRKTLSRLPVMHTTCAYPRRSASKWMASCRPRGRACIAAHWARFVCLPSLKDGRVRFGGLAPKKSSFLNAAGVDCQFCSISPCHHATMPLRPHLPSQGSRLASMPLS